MAQVTFRRFVNEMYRQNRFERRAYNQPEISPQENFCKNKWFLKSKFLANRHNTGTIKK